MILELYADDHCELQMRQYMHVYEHYADVSTRALKLLNRCFGCCPMVRLDRNRETCFWQI